MRYAYAASTIVLLSFGMSLGCHSVKTRSESRIWLSQHNLDHPLVGRIIDVKRARSINEPDLDDVLTSAQFVLLGEKHDNPDHHLLQSTILGRQSDLSVILMEMLTIEQTTLFETLSTVEEIRNASRWEVNGWPSFEIYAPIFKAALKRNLRLGGALPKKQKFTAMLKHLDDADIDLEPTARETLRTHLVAAHCGHSMESLTNYMLKAQFLKDRIMAHELRSQVGTGRGVLIAGNGHIRKDYGIPQHLEGTVSLAFIEVRPGIHELSEYDITPYDYVYFTPVVDPIDACERFRKSLEKMSSPKK